MKWWKNRESLRKRNELNLNFQQVKKNFRKENLTNIRDDACAFIFIYAFIKLKIITMHGMSEK